MAGGIDDYGTHFFIWAAAIARSSAPIFEMGTGHYSTPLGHVIKDFNRGMYSCDTDKAWLEKFRKYEDFSHKLILVEKGAGNNDEERWRAGWLKTTEDVLAQAGRLGCALIDGAPGEVRIDVAKRLKGHCTFQVWHDVEGLDVNGDDGGNYQWETIIDSFKYKFIVKDYRPWTAVVSDEIEFKL